MTLIPVCLVFTVGSLSSTSKFKENLKMPKPKNQYNKYQNNS